MNRAAIPERKPDKTPARVQPAAVWHYSWQAINRPEVNMKRLVLSFVLLSFTAGFLSACHTVAGVGKDVKEVGEEVQETAEGK